MDIAGGICSIRRRRWFLAMVGSITAIPVGLGVAALILTMLSKNEFRERD
jgi:ABC-type lipoprotein release transport system permease subunit